MNISVFSKNKTQTQFISLQFFKTCSKWKMKFGKVTGISYSKFQGVKLM